MKQGGVAALPNGGGAQGVYMKWYQSELITSTNHNCCLLMLLCKTDVSHHRARKRKRSLDPEIAHLGDLMSRIKFWDRSETAEIIRSLSSLIVAV